MIRSVWKPPFSKAIIFQKAFLEYKQKKIIVLSCKNSVIFPTFVGNIFLVYNGRKFINIQVHNHMVGYKFGQYVKTKKTYND